MKNLFLLFILFFFQLLNNQASSNLSFQDDSFQKEPCNANFQYSSSATPELELNFKNLSTGTFNKVLWHFGDGTISNSRDSVKHIYAKAGKYLVKLYIYDTVTGCKSIKTNRIEVGNVDFYADFTYFAIDSIAGIYKFLNKSSNPSKCFWEFGDGAKSFKKNPLHRYKLPGKYFVKLTIKNDEHITSYTKEIIVKPNEVKCMANFYNIVEFNHKKVYLLNESNSSNKTRYLWNFGDGNIDYNKNTSHVYEKNGIYQVCLSIYDSILKCNSFHSDEVKILDSNEISNNFEYFIDSTNNVSFVSTSKNINNLKWFFGDNTFSNESNVTHNYENSDLYLVHLQEYFNDFVYHQSKLINVNSNDTSLACKFGVIVDDEFEKAVPPRGYTGAIRSQPSRIFWNFGDNKFDSTTIAPIHTYNDTGYYNVCLTVFNENSQYNYCKNIYVGNVSSNNYTNLKTESNFLIYPNPINNDINLEFINNKNIEILHIKIYNSIGLEVFNYYLLTSKGLNQHKINVESLKNGLYFFKIENIKESYSKKIIILK